MRTSSVNVFVLLGFLLLLLDFYVCLRVVCLLLGFICTVVRNLTLLASKENNGNIVLGGKKVMLFCSCDFWINP